MGREEQVLNGVKGNVLYELAQAMAVNNAHSEAAALRILAQAGYSSLDQVDSASDWTILSIPGLGIGRLAAVRRLTRLNWQPPSPPAVKAIRRFVSAARFALRLWPVETLFGMLANSPAPAIPADQPVIKRLALDLLCQATNQALCYCTPVELTEILRQVGHSRIGTVSSVGRSREHQLEEQENEQHNGPVACVGPSSTECSSGRNSEHFAFTPNKRRAIVQHYRTARESGQVTNKDAWADKNYGISGRTLLRYEREYEQAEAMV